MSQSDVPAVDFQLIYLLTLHFGENCRLITALQVKHAPWIYCISDVILAKTLAYDHTFVDVSR
jgi:hypothetical protein